MVCPLSLVECVHRSTKVWSGGELLEGMPSGCCAWSAIARSGHRTTDLDVLEWHIELERVSWCACVSECVMHSCRACLSWGMSLMWLWQDGRSKNRFSRPKEPIASPPPVKSDKVMRADGAWFYLTSEPPEAGTWIASNRNGLCAVMPVLYMLVSGGGLRQGGQ